MRFRDAEHLAGEDDDGSGAITDLREREREREREIPRLATKY